ncbi:hypothetical protein HRI_000916400 [Hibiscus trionum]|uniref:Uncharacterized protein n=1 Tax=Hibiscus trionum TaxID=183268 RepID=A0A9W7LQN1_HIBTR|nr:hypothetical protein HRI_000916400 [Hibiscus trionum]
MPNNSADSPSDLSSSLSKVGKMFTNKKVNVVLDETNFLLWKQQVLLTVRSHRLERLLMGKLKPPPEMVPGENGDKVLNEDYEIFVAQDSALASWLLSTIDAPLLPQFVGAETAADVWNTVVQFFANKSTTCAMSLHCKLRSIRKGDESMRSYLTQIKEVSDALVACGSSISDMEQIATILNGLPIEYQPFMAVIIASKDPYTLDGVKSVLVDAEAQIKGFSAQLQLHISVNIARFQSGTPVQSSSAHRSGGQQQLSNGTQQFSGGNQQFSNSTQQFSGGQQQFSGGRHGARGRGRARLQCQLCGKLGHSVDRCWRCFDQSFAGVLAGGGDTIKDSISDHDSNAHANLTDASASCYTCTHSPGSTPTTTSDSWVVDT